MWTLFCSSLSILLGQGVDVIFQLESSVLLVHGAVAMIHFENSILQLKHYLSVMGTGILSIAKLKLSITLIKSTALNTHVQAHTLYTHSYKRTANVSIVRHLYFNSERFTKQKPFESRPLGEKLSFTFNAWFVYLMATCSENWSCLLFFCHSGCFFAVLYSVCQTVNEHTNLFVPHSFEWCRILLNMKHVRLKWPGIAHTDLFKLNMFPCHGQRP